ncbi:MAG: HNH endonuclease [Sulfitobacter sp.]|uniref:HNH endonuclease n=1 Tax=Alphaproteobacteria TaxID=28211 RepID=UPI0029436485|nr:HNH endonuclease [Sulfitobacter sp. LC.270.F.C4]WOI13572.1 HNH endonuclease [Sulfitobacter sp. LC.270.F.C4]
MNKEDLLTAEVLRNLLRYEPETGKLFWQERPEGPQGWNTRYAGTEALRHVNSYGHCAGNIFGKNYYAHRVIWCMVTGAWPADVIDHINGDGADNRIENLREASCAQNQHNAKVRADNSSGFKGVAWDRRHQKWRAYITCDGKRRHVGLFSSPLEAHAAQCAAASKYHGEFAYKP